MSGETIVVEVEQAQAVTVEIDVGQSIVVEIPMGPAGQDGQDGTGGGSAIQTYIQDDAPVVPPGTKYLWVQTGLGPTEEDFTINFDDGE